MQRDRSGWLVDGAGMHFHSEESRREFFDALSEAIRESIEWAKTRAKTPTEQAENTHK